MEKKKVSIDIRICYFYIYFTSSKSFQTRLKRNIKKKSFSITSISYIRNKNLLLYVYNISIFVYFE